MNPNQILFSELASMLGELGGQSRAIQLFIGKRNTCAYDNLQWRFDSLDREIRYLTRGIMEELLGDE